MANKIGSGFSLNGKNIDLIKEDNFQTNPIQVNKVIKMGGKKIAYLMYTQFSQGFDKIKLVSLNLNLKVLMNLY